MKTTTAHSLLGALVLGLSLASMTGCASATDSGFAESEVQADNDAPKAVREAANVFRLGAPKPSEAHGHVHEEYLFEKGTIGYSFATEKVDAVQIRDASLPEWARDVTLVGAALQTALYLEVGPLTGFNGIEGHSNYEFQHATVHYSNIDKKVASVSWRDQLQLRGEVLTAAVSLELGKFVADDHAAGSTYYQFARGDIQMTNEFGTVSSVTVKDPEVVSDAPSNVLPAKVVKAILAESLGRLLRVTTKPGQVSYVFQLGTVVLNEHGAVEIVRN